MITRVKIIAWLVFAANIGGVYGDKYDIVVKNRAIVQRCITDKSARNIAVGMPGQFNFSFDPVKCRLAYVWYGDFLNFRKEATSRGGGMLDILGTKRLLGTADIPLRIGDAQKEPDSIVFKGYRKETATGIPTFLFQVDDVHVEQRVLSFADDQVTIELSFPQKGRSSRYYLMDPSAVASVELSDRLRMNDKGVIEIPASETWAQIRLKLKPVKDKFVRKGRVTDGKVLYATYCMACHTLDGSKRIGPSFADLWTGKRSVIREGRTVELDANEAYVRESILQPQAAIVVGYEKAGQMVDLRGTLNEEQLEALLQFLTELKTGK